MTGLCAEAYSLGGPRHLLTGVWTLLSTCLAPKPHSVSPGRRRLVHSPALSALTSPGVREGPGRACHVPDPEVTLYIKDLISASVQTGEIGMDITHPFNRGGARG